MGWLGYSLLRPQGQKLSRRSQATIAVRASAVRRLQPIFKLAWLIAASGAATGSFAGSRNHGSERGGLPRASPRMWTGASAVIRKQLDRIAEAAHRIFADPFEIELALHEVGKRTGQQHRFSQLLGERFET
jgi:hypothetical protein